MGCDSAYYRCTQGQRFSTVKKKVVEDEKTSAGSKQRRGYSWLKKRRALFGSCERESLEV